VRYLFRAKVKRDISTIQAMRVSRKANPEVRVMKMVPIRWYARPQIPNMKARKEKKAAV